MYDPATCPFVHALDEVYHLLEDTFVSQYLPQSCSVDAVEGLLIVKEVDNQLGVPLKRLLHYDPQSCNLVGSRSILSTPAC